METDNQAQNPPIPHQPEVSFPQPREPQGNNNIKIIIAVVGVILILVAGGWLVLGNTGGGASQTPTPTPNGGLTTFPTTAPTPTPSATPTPEPVDKSEIRIEILNGTGVPGEASFLQGELEDLGFEEITAGNADTQDAGETTVTYSRDLSPAISDEITEALEEIYETVRTRTATISGDYDVSIVTGPRASTGASATTSPTPTATPEE